MNITHQQIADRLGTTLDDELTMCIEGACITLQEWESDPDGCLQRVRGAMEEIGFD